MPVRLCAESPLSLQLRIMARRFAHTICQRRSAACLHTHTSSTNVHTHTHTHTHVSVHTHTHTHTSTANVGAAQVYRMSITDTQTPCTDKPDGGVRSLSREIDLGWLHAIGGEATRRVYVEASRPGVVRLPRCLVSDLVTGERDWLVLDCVTSVLAERAGVGRVGAWDAEGEGGT